jgi:hypothetical protein
MLNGTLVLLYHTPCGFYKSANTCDCSMKDAPSARCTPHQIVMMIYCGVGEVAAW